MLGLLPSTYLRKTDSFSSANLTKAKRCGPLNVQHPLLCWSSPFSIAQYPGIFIGIQELFRSFSNNFPPSYDHHYRQIFHVFHSSREVPLVSYFDLASVLKGYREPSPTGHIQEQTPGMQMVYMRNFDSTV